MADIYTNEIKKLKHAGYVEENNVGPIAESQESWYIPHHLVEHNDKHCVVFNCSFTYQGQSLNDQLLPDPITPNLLLIGRRDASLPQAVYTDTCLDGDDGSIVRY